MWEFETDPGYPGALDWADRFVREEIAPLQYVIPNALELTDPARKALILPLPEQAKAPRSVGPPILGPSSEAKGTARSSWPC